MFAEPMTVDSHYDLVSVVIPTHNRADFVKQAIESVLNQSYGKIQIIVVDDGSTDNTGSALKVLFKQGIIQYIKHESSQGASAARNTGIWAAKGRFIAGLDDDDMFTPQRIEELIKAYDPRYAFVYSNSYIVRRGKKILRKYASRITFKKILYRNYVGNQIFIERQRLIELDGFDTTLPARQDHDMWARLIERFGPPLLVQKPLMIEVQSHEDRISSVPEKVLNGAKLFYKKHGSKMDRSTQKFYRYYIARLERKTFLPSAFFANFGLKVALLEIRYVGIWVRNVLMKIKNKVNVIRTTIQSNA